MSDADKARHELTNGLLEATEQMGPLLDAAEGHRAEMERRGWSPTAAEAAALEFYLALLRVALARPS